MAANIIQERQILQGVLAPGKLLATSSIFPLFCLGLLSCFLLAACAMSLGTARERYEVAPVASYQSLADFPYEKLSLNDSKAFRIDEHSPAFDFATGKSFFKAFSLPLSPMPFTVTVRSYVSDHIYTDYIFAPRVIFLNEHFTVTRTLGKSDFHYAQPGLFETWGQRAMLEGSTRIDQSVRDERYLIILTTKEALQKKTTLEYPVIIPINVPGGGVVLIPTGETMGALVPNSPVGNLRIILE